METIRIKTDYKQYPVLLGKGILNELSSIITSSCKDVTKLLIITDEIVADLYLEQVKDNISGMDFSVKIVPAGEKAKTFEVYYDCLSYALEQQFDRKSLILALGGGAVGDLAGFVASTFMRGIPFIQIPTTILAHDSAVGGKVAINHPLGKNMIGSFHQPEAVVYDLDFLKSLPQYEKRSGFAEIIKHALIHDTHFYHWLRENVTSLEHLSDEILLEAIKLGISIKGAIVEQDEKETGIRAFLNFGHTLGHAIEAEMGYGGITHGEAVAIGMRFALQLSVISKGLEFDQQDFAQWLQSLGYQTTLPPSISTEKLLIRMKQDKKSISQKVRFVLLKEIGSPVLEEISDEELRRQLELF